MRPLIGMIPFCEEVGDKGEDEEKLVKETLMKYAQELHRLGVLPVIFFEDIDRNDIRTMDAILLYGRWKGRGEGFGELKEREKYRLIFSETNSPLLCVGQGCSVLNHLCDGRVSQGMQVHTPKIPGAVLPEQDIRVYEGTKLFECIGKSSMMQEVKVDARTRKIGENLRVSAMNGNGDIVGVEGVEERFILGIEWDLIDETKEEKLLSDENYLILSVFIQMTMKYSS